MTESAPGLGEGPPAPTSQSSMHVHDEGHIHSSPSPNDGPHETDASMNTPALESFPDHTFSTTREKAKGKGKAKGLDTDVPVAAAECRLLALPNELLESILSHLPPADLARVWGTCRALYILATDDHLWQTHVQDNVPGQNITSSYPCASFRELYAAHEPRWFLPKYKIWFADATLLGRLIVARYDQRRGCIEGHYLLATNRADADDVTPWESGASITPFDPLVNLFLDRPCVRLTAKPEEDDDAILVLRPNGRGACASDEESGPSTSEPRSRRPQPQKRKKAFEPEFPMYLSAKSRMKSSFHHTRCLPAVEALERSIEAFPYSNIWPPPTIPAPDRVLGAGLERPTYLRSEDRATTRSEVYEKAFRTCNWFEMSALEDNIPLADRGISFTDEARALSLAIRRHSTDPLIRRVTIGEEIATYATLDPHLYTPTAEKPFRGIWVGDYSAHGCEFLLMHQPDDDPNDPFDPSCVVQLEGETDQDYASRKRDATVYRGRLEAIKLTGDANVPRGEPSFIVDDFGKGDAVINVDHPNLRITARVFECRGHIARNGFTNDEYIDSQLWVISPDRLAHYWRELRHINFFHRVDIDQFLVPE